MLGIIFFILAIITGNLIARPFTAHLTRSERLAAGSAIGLAAASWLGFLLTMVLGPSTGLVATIIVMIGIITGLLIKTRLGASTSIKEPAPGAPILRTLNWLLIAALCLLMVWLALSHFLPSQDGALMSAGYTWADMALHASLIASFAQKTTLDLTLPIFADSKLTYPFMVDFLSAQMLRLGAGWQMSVLLPSLALLYAVIRLLMGLFYRLTSSLRAAWIALAMTLLSGSAWGAALFFKDAAVSGLPVGQILRQDYSKLDQNHLQYANFITSHLLPQRAYLFGFACALIIFINLWKIVQVRGDRRINWRLAWLTGILLGAMPLIHTHSFLVAAGFTGILWLVTSARAGKLNRDLLLILIIAAGLATPQLVWQFTSYHESFGGWQFGWLTPAGMNVAVFWLRQLGLALLLFGLGPILLRRQKAHYFTVTLYWFGVLLFVAGNVYVFQPSAWDNMKFFTYAYWMMIIPAALELAKISRVWWGRVVLAVTLLLTCSTGIIALAHEAQVGYVFASRSDREFAEKIHQRVPSDAVILVNPSLHHNPVSMLGGRNIFTGYNGWLWSYGIDYGPREEAARSMLLAADRDVASLLARHEIDFVAISKSDIMNGAADLTYYQTHYPEIINQDGWYVFEIVPR